MEEEQKPEFLIDTTKGKDMKKGVTVVIVFARTWCVKPFFRNFDKMEMNRRNTHLLVIDNTDRSDLRDALLERMEGYKSGFYTVRLYKTYRQLWKPSKKMQVKPGLPAGMWRAEHRRD